MGLARSRHKVGTGYTGPIPDECWDVVREAHDNGISVSSNLAREASAWIALAASLGWISTVTLDGQHYGRVWRTTFEGLSALRNKEQP